MARMSSDFVYKQRFPALELLHSEGPDAGKSRGLFEVLWMEDIDEDPIAV